MSTVIGPRVTFSYGAIAAFCRRWNIAELAVFGSALRDDFGPESDIDMLVTFRADVVPALADLLDMEDELQSLLGRRVDLIERQSVEHSPNYLRRREVLTTARVIYAEG